MIILLSPDLGDFVNSVSNFKLYNKSSPYKNELHKNKKAK